MQQLTKFGMFIQKYITLPWYNIIHQHKNKDGAVRQI